MPSACATGYDLTAANIASVVGGMSFVADSSGDDNIWRASLSGSSEFYLEGTAYCTDGNYAPDSVYDFDDFIDNHYSGEGKACFCDLITVNGMAAKSLVARVTTFNTANACESGCRQACADAVATAVTNNQFGELAYSTLVDKCVPHTYNYQFRCNSGSSIITSGQIKYDATLTAPSHASCSKEGYEFGSWISSPAGTNFTSDITWNWTADQTFVVNWRATSHTITLKANGAAGGTLRKTSMTSSVQQATFDCYTNNSMYLPEWNSAAQDDNSRTNIYKPGYIFKGWSTDSSCASASCVTDVTTCPTVATTYYAVWENAQSGCQSGGTGVSSTSYESIVDNALSCNVTCNAGYSQSGGTNTTTSFTSVSSTAGVATYKPNCQKNSIFAITVDSKEYSSTSDQNGTAATTAGAPATVYLWYNNGWYSDANATTAISSMSTKPKLDKSVFNGYYTAKAGTGTKVVSAASAFDTSKKTAFNSASTMFADYTACAYTKGTQVKTVTVTGTNNSNQCTYSYECNTGYHTGNSGTSATGTYTGATATATNQSPNCSANTNTITLNGNGATGGKINNSAMSNGAVTFTCNTASSMTLPTWDSTDASGKTSLVKGLKRFLGWATTNSATTADAPSTCPTAAATYYAVWSADCTCSHCTAKVTNNACDATCATGYSNKTCTTTGCSCSANTISIIWNGIKNENAKTTGGTAMTEYSNHTAKSSVTYDGSIATPTSDSVWNQTGQTFVGWKFSSSN